MRELDYHSVFETVKAYAIAFHEGDAEALGGLFLPDCKLQFTENGHLKCFSATDWIEVVRTRQSPADRGCPIDFRISMLHMAGEDCASAALDMSTPGELFRDILHLLRVQQGWRIVAKSFSRFETD